MKLFTSLCVLLLVWIDFSMPYPKYENCTEEFPRAGLQDCSCCRVKCSSDGRGGLSMDMVTCAVAICPEGKLLKYMGGDDALEYPDCCSYPVCRD